MKLIIGLGNPGEKYHRTRHNAGFLFLDFLQKTLELEAFHEEKKFDCEITSGHFQKGKAEEKKEERQKEIQEEKFFLVKPSTFMNDSGRAVLALMQFYKLTPDDILVAHDELDLPLGTFRKARDSRSAGHNGVQNIIDCLGTQDFTRLRIGISRPEPAETGTCISVHDYVLQNFSDEERKKLEVLFPDLQKEALVGLVG